MINHWIFRCRDVSYLISRSMDQKLPLRTRMGIKFHLMMCDLCLRYKKQLELIHNAITKIEDSEVSEDLITPLPDGIKKKIQDKLEETDLQ